MRWTLWWGYTYIDHKVRGFENTLCLQEAPYPTLTFFTNMRYPSSFLWQWMFFWIIKFLLPKWHVHQPSLLDTPNVKPCPYICLILTIDIIVFILWWIFSILWKKGPNTIIIRGFFSKWPKFIKFWEKKKNTRSLPY